MVVRKPQKGGKRVESSGGLNGHKYSIDKHLQRSTNKPTKGLAA
jgi:hypothetical protein